MLTADDLASPPAERSREIDVVEFVPSDQVDLLTLDKAYYLEPDSASPKAYVLLRRRSSRPTAPRSCGSRCVRRPGSRRCASAATCSCCRRCCGPTRCARPRSPSLDEPVRISAKELELSASLVESFASDFDPSEFTDEYQEELRTLIEAKIEQGDALDTSETFGDHEEEETGGEVIDLMAALRASVERSRAAREGKSGEKDAAREAGGQEAAAAKAAAKPAAKKPAAKKKPAKAS